MKKQVAFEKDITFKTKIGELTSIALENDLTLKGENLVVGNFYIKGTYKMLETSNLEEEYSYKIPCEIAISDDYDTYDSKIEIEDFTYEIINDEILRVNIKVEINNLVRKQEDEEERNIITKENKELKELIEKINKNEEKVKEENKISTVKEDIIDIKNNINNDNDNYLTYSVYTCKEGDKVEKILEKYNISKEELENYNDIEKIEKGMKLVIPSLNDKL